MSFYRASAFLNALFGGHADQTLCARIAESHGTDCWFCRLMSKLIEADHCAIELARWVTRRPS